MAMTLITTNTATNAASSTFTADIDNTYKLYIFKFHDVNPVDDTTEFGFQVNASGQSGYNETIQSDAWNSYNAPDGSNAGISYQATLDQQNGTSLQYLFLNCGSGADETTTGTLWLFNPSDTTYATHFYSRFSGGNGDNYATDEFHSGYINVTAAITEVSFSFTSGNFDGVIAMYGVDQ